MVLAEVKEQHVMQAFSLIGKVAAVTGKFQTGRQQFAYLD